MTVLYVILIIIVMLVVDGIFEWLSLPVVTLDLVLSVGALGFGIWSIRHLVTSKWSSDERPIAIRERLGFLGIAILFFAAGVGMSIAGLDDPFLLLSGVKGPAHGYSMVVIGIILGFVGLHAVRGCFVGRPLNTQNIDKDEPQ